MRTTTRAVMSLSLFLAACGSEEPAPEPQTESAPEQLVAIRHGAPIRAEAAPDAAVVGRLRLGAVIEPGESIEGEGCERGWYAVEPTGVVCLDEGTAAHEGDPTLPGPTDRAMPYRYARVRKGGAVMYDAVPTKAALLRAEPDRDGGRRADRRMGAGANDVPFDENGFPAGPPVVRPGTAGVGPDGYRSSGRFFVFDDPLELEPGQRLLPVAPTVLAEVAQRTIPAHETVRHRSGVALATTVVVDERRYGVTPDGHFIPTERLRPTLGSPWHGVDVRDIELPLAFALRTGVHPRRMEDGKPVMIEDFEYTRNEPIQLTGRFRTELGRKYFFTKSGHWMRHEDLIIAFGRHEYPDFAVEGVRWIDISLANQWLVAYEGRTPVYVTLISSGRDRIGDPETEPATPQGVLRVVEKRVTIEVDPREVQNKYSVAHAPWALVTDDERVVIHGNYWQRHMAWPRGHHHITLSPVDARWLFDFVAPERPADWHSVSSPEDGAIIYVHK